MISCTTAAHLARRSLTQAMHCSKGAARNIPLFVRTHQHRSFHRGSTHSQHPSRAPAAIDDIHRNCGYEAHRMRERREEEELEAAAAATATETAAETTTTSTMPHEGSAGGFQGADTVDIGRMGAKERSHYLNVLMPELCKQWSPELYQLGLRVSGMMSPLQRDLFFTLFALNGEIGHIKDATKSPSTGMLRVEWWRSGIRSALRGDQCARVPVLIALAIINRTIREQNETSGLSPPHRELRFSDFRELFRWRELDLQWRQPATYDILEKYAEGVYSHLLYAQLKSVYTEATRRQAPLTPSAEIVDGSPLQKSQSSSSFSSSSSSRMRMEMETDHIASHIGKCFGLVQLLRGTPSHARQQATYLPADLCAQAGVTEDMIYRQAQAHFQTQQPKSEARYVYEVDPAELHRISEVVYHVADYANAHLRHARQLSLDKVPSEAMPLFYLTTICDVFLQRLQKVDFNIFHPSLAPDALRLPYLLKLAIKPWWSGKNKF